jgi:hypothetical protein
MILHEIQQLACNEICDDFVDVVAERYWMKLNIRERISILRD